MGRLILFVGSFVLTTIFYRPILNLSFTQDDWFLVRQAKFNSLHQQFIASLPNVDSIYFRPLGMQGYFYLTHRLFGLHEWMYRLVTIVIHSSNVVLLFSLSSFLSPSVILSLAFSFLYLLAPLHLASLGWLANVSFVTGTFMTFLILKIALDGRNKLSITLFFLGLLVNELVITTPLLLILLEMMKERSSSARFQSRTVWMVGIGIGYFLFRLFSSRPGTDAYALTLDPRIVAQNIRWLFLWSLGWPETVRDHFVSLFSMRREFVRTFPLETAAFAITTIVSVGLMVKAVLRKPQLAMGLTWFLVAISPVVFFRSHVFPHYAMIGSIGLYFLIISGFRHLHPSFKFLFLVLWLIQSFFAFRVNLITHWWVQHARLSQELIDQTRRQYSTIPSDKTIVLSVRDPKRAEIVLAGDSAMQVLYNDPAVKTEFVKGEWSSLPESESSTTWSGDPLDGSKR